MFDARKYLLFCAWHILSIEGILALEPGSDEIHTSGDLDEQGIYYYVPVVGLGAFYLHDAITVIHAGYLRHAI